MENHTKTDKLLLLGNKIVLTICILIVMLPLLYILLGSFLDPNVLLSKGFSLNPADWSLEGYKRIFQDDLMIRGFINSIIYSVGFTLVTVAVTIFAAYPLSIEGFKGKNVFMVFFLITMFFNGGLIPTYLVVKDLGMLNTIWAIILPGAINVWNIILARTFFKGLPKELFQAAKIDGASELKIF